MRGDVSDLCSSELLEVQVEGYEGNPRELTYKWTGSLGTYLYIYNSHNMYGINNTYGEYEIYNTDKKVNRNSNVEEDRSGNKTLTKEGFMWASVYGAYVHITCDQSKVSSAEIIEGDKHIAIKSEKKGSNTYEIGFGNSTFEVDYGEELIISVVDMPLDFDSYAFFVNEMLVPTDENGNLVITVKGYMLIRAMGYTKLPVPDTDDKNESENNNSSDKNEDEKPLNWFQRIIKAIKEFFEKLFGIKK